MHFVKNGIDILCAVCYPYHMNNRLRKVKMTNMDIGICQIM